MEILVERVISPQTFLAHMKASKAPKPGAFIYLEKDWCIEIINKQNDLYLCQISGDVDVMLHDIGHIPLPFISLGWMKSSI